MLKYYKLDPCHYFSSPGLSFPAMLKMTGAKLEQISDTEKYLIIEKALTGGISCISKRHSEANKYIDNYNPEKESKYIMHLNKNNFYGWGMSGYLPYCGFKKFENVDNSDVNSISEKSPIGYILEVDLEYPDELDNDYPLAPEKLAASYDMLSGYCKEISDKYGIKVGAIKKLVPNLGSKTNYILYYRYLQLYLS